MRGSTERIAREREKRFCKKKIFCKLADAIILESPYLKCISYLGLEIPMPLGQKVKYYYQYFIVTMMMYVGIKVNLIFMFDATFQKIKKY